METGNDRTYIFGAADSSLLNLKCDPKRDDRGEMGMDVLPAVPYLQVYSKASGTEETKNGR